MTSGSLERITTKHHQTLMVLLNNNIWFDMALMRKLEDKLVQHRVEIRPFFLPVDQNGLNGNREMPSGFQWAICVLDSTLPTKGTAHRATRGADKARKFFFWDILK